MYVSFVGISFCRVFCVFIANFVVYIIYSIQIYSNQILNRFSVGLTMTHANQCIFFSFYDINFGAFLRMCFRKYELSSPVPFVPCLVLHWWTWNDLTRDSSLILFRMCWMQESMRVCVCVCIALVVMFPQRMWCKIKNIFNFNLEMKSLKVRTVSMNAHKSKYQ